MNQAEPLDITASFRRKYRGRMGTMDLDIRISILSMGLPQYRLIEARWNGNPILGIARRRLARNAWLHDELRTAGDRALAERREVQA